MRALIAAIFFLLACQAVAQEVTSPIEQTEGAVVVEQPNDGSGAQQDQTFGETKSGDLCGATYTLNCGPRYYQRSEERDPEVEKRDERDVDAQVSMAISTESMAYWTIVIAIAAILSFLAAGAAAKFAYKTIRVTRRIGEAQTRAYMGAIRPERGKIESSFFIRCYIKNFGYTPAKSVTVTTINVIDGQSEEPVRHYFGRIDPGYEALLIAPIIQTDPAIFEDDKFVFSVDIGYSTVYDKIAGGWRRMIKFYYPKHRVDGTKNGLHIYPDSSTEEAIQAK